MSTLLDVVVVVWPASVVVGPGPPVEPFALEELGPPLSVGASPFEGYTLL